MVSCTFDCTDFRTFVYRKCKLDVCLLDDIENNQETLKEIQSNNYKDFNNIKNCNILNYEDQNSNIKDDDSYEEKIIFPIKIRFEASFEYDQTKER